MIAYLDGIPVVGLPGGVMHAKRSALDLILPFILSGTLITREMLAGFGLGGLCLQCADCHYPVCPFGTGI
jgi:hypothetical protein